MRRGLIETVFRQAEASAFGDRDGLATDADLYRAFLADGSHSAFAGIVHRHGPMVWGVCRNLLNENDSQDAFQATFLALIRAGAAVRDPSALGGWLHRAAVLVCTRLKREATNRRRRETRAAAPETARPNPDTEWQELHAAVHAAIDRLPGRLRAVFVLCGLEGVRPTDAAARLGVRVGTVTGLLTRARQRVLARLKNHGLVPGLAGGAVLAITGSTAAVPFALLERVMTLTRPDGTAGVPSTVLSLARLATEVPMVRLKVLAAVTLVGITLSASVGGRFLATSMAQPPANQFRPNQPTEYQPPMNAANPVTPLPGQPLTRGGLTDPNTVARPRPQWEYKVVHLRADGQSELNDLGKGGWELVAVERNLAGIVNAYLKRSVPVGSTTTTRTDPVRGPNTLMPIESKAGGATSNLQLIPTSNTTGTRPATDPTGQESYTVIRLHRLSAATAAARPEFLHLVGKQPVAIVETRPNTAIYRSKGVKALNRMEPAQ